MTDREWLDSLVGTTNLWIEKDRLGNYHIDYLGHAPHAVVEVFITNDIARVTAFIRGFMAALTQVNGVNFSKKENDDD